MGTTSSIVFHDLTFEPFINEASIQERVKVLAQEINRDYEGKRPLFIAVLNGAFMFAAELLKHVELNCEINFIRVASYHGTNSTGELDEILGLDADVLDRDLIILEDIVDTGLTMSEVMKQLQQFSPASIKVATLLFKPSAMKKELKLDYVGFEIPDDFVLGFGLDYDGLGRNLPQIYKKSTI